MNFERSNSNEAEQNMEKMTLVRDEMRSALMLDACSNDPDQDTCYNRWANTYNPLYDELFDNMLLNSDPLLGDWDDEAKQSEIIKQVRDRLEKGYRPQQDLAA